MGAKILVFPEPGFTLNGSIGFLDFVQWGAYFRIALAGSENPRYSNNPDTIDTFPTSLGFII
ncbi:MAG: hypothetical protein R6V74_04490, partial [Lutibacter sp.]